MTKSKRLLPWFGSNSENAPQVGLALAGCRFVAIPFAGGMSEVPWIEAKQILCNDRHRHVINLCKTVASKDKRGWLIEQADSQPYHPDVLQEFQQIAAESVLDRHAAVPNAYAALAYFVCCWMGRGGKAGTNGELKGQLPIRWNANGGGSNQRYRTAIEALEQWGQTFRRCEFSCLDAFEFVAKCFDTPETGIYSDSPWPDAGKEYRHRFSDDDQRRLADALGRFQHARVVVRFGEHPLIRELYPEPAWTWNCLSSRDQANQVKPEFLITRNCPCATS